MHLESGPGLKFKCREVKFGRYEADTLDVYECGTEKGNESILAGWSVGSIEIGQRQDWLEPATPTTKTLGINPVTHAWGPIGSAPPSATHTLTVNSSVTFFSERRDYRAMIYLIDYPGLVSFTTDARQISAVHRANGGQP